MAAADDGHHDEDSMLVTEEDLAFVQSIGSRNAFLTEMELPAPKQWINPRKAKRKRAKEMQQIAKDEQDYEQKPRISSEKRAKTDLQTNAKSQFAGDDAEDDKERATGRLPIKVGKRLVHAPKRVIVAPDTPVAATQNAPQQTNESEMPQSPDMETEKITAKVPTKRKNPLGPTQGKTLADYKLEIASLAADILAAPEDSTSKLRELRELCSCNDANPAIATSVTKLAIMSLATVFKDIIPGYRIRDLTEKEKAVKVSKEVQKERDYDESLLRNYQMYLKRLHALVKTGGTKSNANSKRAVGLMIVSIRAMCMLLTGVTHFNYRSNIIELVIPRMNDERHPDVADLCCETITQLFRNDKQFDATQETVKAMSRVIKASNYRVREAMLHCFFDLRLSEAAIKSLQLEKEREDANTRAGGGPGFHFNMGKMGKHKSRMKKKEQKAHKELDKQLKDAQMDVDLRALARRQLVILNQVFATYFRILKHGRTSPLLPTTLQGLSRHAHLIDASFFGDLMSVLRDIMRDPLLGADVSLQCVRTGCTLLSGQSGMALNIDAKAFHDALYVILFDIPGDNKGVELALMCFRLLLHERREMSLERVAAFVKRLCQICTHLEPHQAVAAMFNVRSMLLKYPKLAQMLDNDVVTNTSYRPDVLEPEHSNPMAAPLWELALLYKHYYPWMPTYAKHVAAGAPSTGGHALNPKHARAQPHEIYASLDKTCHGFSFNPPMQAPKQHPMRQKSGSGPRHSGHIDDPGLTVAQNAVQTHVDASGDLRALSEDDAEDVLQRWGCALDADRVRRRLDRLTRQKDALQSILKRFNKHAAKKATAGVKKKPKKSKLKLGRGIVA
eukprot:m.740210 g.740210  ORF g.740210 m.740210 type:complete len:844 (-) comp23112_c0_seq2:1926-4457(-)